MKPLILTTPDVQSILSGNKGRHSVPVKFRKKGWRISYEANKEGRTDLDAFGVRDKNGNLIEIEEGMPGTLKELGLSPFGSPGDQEWQTGMPTEDGMYWVDWQTNPLLYYKSDPLKDIDFGTTVRWKKMGAILYLRESWNWDWVDLESRNKKVFYYKATTDSIMLASGEYWRSPATMPREAARIYLEVTNIICQRVQDITYPDIMKEGITMEQLKGCEPLIPVSEHFHHEYKKQWQSRHGPDSWNNNDFVFSCNWKVLSITGKPSYL